jgi:autotransporter-associated beta strand protein
MVAAAIFGVGVASAPKAQAANLYWDADGTSTDNSIAGAGANIGGTGTWDASATRWFNETTNIAWANSSDDTAYFIGPAPALGSSYAVDLASPITVGGLNFGTTGYVLSSSTNQALILGGTTPSIRVGLGLTATINSKVSGSNGLTMTGNGTLRLGNSANDYTGTTTISRGALVISNSAALGSDSSVIVVNGSAARGAGGGALVLDGTSAPVTLTRSLSLQGYGPIADRSSALVSIGDNVLTATITMAEPTGGANIDTRITSAAGMLTLSAASTLVVQGTAATNLSIFGGGNQAGAVGYTIAGTITGTGTLEKTGAGTLFLNPSSVSGFSGAIRVTSNSVTGTQGTIRITNPGVIGSRTGTGASSLIDLNAGILELRMNTPTLQTTGATNANVYSRSSTAATFFLDHAPGGDAVNGTLTLGEFGFAAGAATTFSSRNGYGFTFGAAPVVNTNNSNTITNSVAGTLTFTGTFWSNTNNEAARTLTIAGNGNTLISGAVTASSTNFNHNLVKTGTGLLTINNQASTLDGTVSVEGSLAIRDIRAIGAATNAESITLGNATATGGNLIFGTASAPTAANLSTSRPIILNGTTANNAIYASQSGATGVTLSGTITAPLATTGSLILGGTNTADNTISAIIPAGGGTTPTNGLIKQGVGTWRLSGVNAYAGATTITAGTLKLAANAATSTIVGQATANTVVFNVDAVTQNAGGVLEFVGVSGSATTEALGALTPTAGGGTVRLTSGGAGAAASLTFTSLGTVANGVGVNVVTTAGGGGTVTLTSATNTNGIVNPQIYFNGADFAASTGGTLGAATYTSASGSLAASNTLPYLINSNIAQSANATVNGGIKITGNTTTYTLNSSITTTIQAAANTAGGILVTGSTGATITGGTGLSSGGTGTLAVRVDGGSDVLTIASPLTNGTTGGLTKNGAGLLILSSASNAQTGATTINEGTVRLSGSGRLSGANAALVVRQGAFLDLNGVSTGTAIGSLNGSGSIVNGQSGTPAAATLTVGNNNGTGTFTGVIGNGTGGALGALGVTKVGTGAMSWLGSSTYTGVTTIGSTGLVTVNVLANGGVASGIGQSSSAASNLVFNGTTGGLVYAGGLLNGSLAVGTASASTDRLFTLAAASTGATLSSTAGINAIVWSATGAVDNLTTAAATLIFTGTSTGDNTFNPQLVNSSAGGTPALSVSKTAAGQWNLGNSNNTYSGSTNIAEGILGLNNNGALSANSPLTFSAGATTSVGVLQMSGSFTRSLAASAVAGTPSVTWASTSTGGGGFAAHSTGLVVAIGGTLSPTALTWASGGFVGTGGVQSLFLSSTTALAEVDFRNAINLNGALRSVNVQDNGNTAADYAILSGVLSGTGTSGLQKLGGGILKLTGANTYAGITDISGGTLIVDSLGSSTGAATSSVGAGGVVMGNANAVTIGNAGTGGAILQYVGPGETSDRKIRFNSTTGAPQIHADGAGALILTNVVNDYSTPTGAKALTLRGSSTAGNTISSNLTNDAGTPTAGTLAVTIDGGATWILSGTNTFTGALTVAAGAFGVGSDSATGSGSFIHTGGLVFASGADRTIGNTLYTSNNTTTGVAPAFIGDYSLTITNAWVHTNTSTSNTVTNSIVNGKLLTLNGGLTYNAISASRTITFNGTGDTVLNVGVSTTTAFGVNTTYSGTGSLTLGGTINPGGGALTISSGAVRLGANERIPAGAAAADVVISPAAGASATFDLNGFSETINGLTANSSGNVTINNRSASSSTLSFGDNNATVTFGGGAGANSITQSGGGAISLVKIGTGTANLTGTLGNTGSTTVSGGTFNYNSTTGTTAVSVASGAFLNLKGGLTTPASMTGVTLAGGGSLSFASGLGQAMANLTSLSLGVGSGTAVLELDAGDTGTDTLTLVSGVATAANTISLLIKDIDLSDSQQYTLISAPGGGLTSGGATYQLNLAGYTGSFITSTDTSIVLTTGTLITSDIFWNAGASTTAWNTVLTGPDRTNFSANLAGTTAVADLPGKGQKVIFIADNITGVADLSTTLEQPFKINALQFRPSTTPANTPASVTIAPGAVLSNSLTLAPGSSVDGISMATGASPTVTISAPVVAQTAQTWTVADAAQALNISGALSGAGNITKAGAGTLTLSSAGSGYTGAFAVNAGTVVLTNATALSGVVATPSSGATVSIGGTGAFYFNNATAGTVPNPITLSGGTISGGGGNHTYSGAISVTAASVINMADLNGPATNAARNITFSGALTGTGALTIDSNNTDSGGNQLGGTLTVNNASGNWSGNLAFSRGTMTIAAAASANVVPTDLTFNSFGRFHVQGVDGRTINRSGTLTYAANAVGEIQVDNTTGTQVTDFVVNQNGAVTLGAGSAVRIALPDQLARFNIAGAVTLAGNASISVSNAATRVLTISGVIGETGGARSLALNDDFGGSGWNQTNGIITLTAANTYSGGTTLASGTLILGDKASLGSGALTVSGASILQAGIVLTGTNAVANNVTLSEALTISGANALTLSGVITQSAGNRTLTNSLTGGASLLLSQVNLAEVAAAAARTLTIAGATTGTTTITALVNNNQSNTLTNNLSAATLSVGTIALSEDSATGRTLTLGGTGNTTVTGVISNFNGVGGTAGILAKAGAGTLQLDSANTYSGGTTLSAGTVLLGNKDALGSGTLTVSGASTLQASTALTGANAVTNALAISAALTFSGNNSLQLSGAANLGAAARTLTANGAAGATLTLSGAISNLATADGSALTLSGNATGTGVISGGITMTGDTADATVNGGTWTHASGTSRIGDDFTVTGATTTLNLASGLLQVRDDFTVTAGAILNLNAAAVLSFSTLTLSADASLRATAGGIINFGANNVVGTTDFDSIRIGSDAAGIGTLNIGTFSQSVTEFVLGNNNTDRSGVVNGTGTLTATANLDVYAGNINANLGSTGTVGVDKVSLNTVTLAGDNSALVGTGTNSIQAGLLILDYTTSNTVKLRAASALGMQGGALTLLGNASAATSQAAASFTLANGGSNRITLTPGSGQDLLLSLGAITRTVSTGTLRINLPFGTQSATHGVTTTTTFAGTIPGYLTVNDDTGTYFAARSLTTGNLVRVVSTTKRDISTWLRGEDVTNTGGGYTGTTASRSINSLAFDSASSGDVTIASAATLEVLGGGILVTSNVTAGTHNITGGALTSGVSELIFTQDGAATINVSSSIGGTNGLTKTGNGTLRVTNAGNSFTGAVNVQAGTMQAAGGNAIGDAATVTLADDQATIFQLLADETIGNLAGGNANITVGTVAIGTNNLTLTLSAGATYDGVFTGSGTITRNGASGGGNLLLRGASGAGFTGALVSNGGLLMLEVLGELLAASSVTLNKGGSLLLSNNGGTRPTNSNRLPDAMPVFLNSADGSSSGSTLIGGLWIRTDQGTTTNETVGVLNLVSGASYFRGDATGTGSIAGIITSNFVRQNNATLAARGRSLGVTSGERNFLRIASASAEEAAFAAGLVGGTGAADTKTIPIVPWVIGQTQTAGMSDSIMGNSLVTYAVATGSGAGLRPLSLTTEYNTFATRAGATDNIRESLSANLTGLTGVTLNALVLENANTTAGSINVTGTGAGQTLAITSGTMLFTATGAVTGTPAMGVTLGGFDGGITVGGTNEYVVFVQNPTSAAAGGTVTATISSPLTSSADITKSGRGVLVLSSANTAGGGARRTTINEGVLQIDALDKIGGTTGELVLAGGTLRFTGAFDPSTRTVRFLQGGATFDTNGNDVTLANSIGGGGAGGFTKTGSGNLTLGASASYLGATNLQGTGRVTLNGGANGRLSSGDLTLAGNASLQLGDAINGASNLTVGVLTGVAANAIIGGGATASVLTVNQLINATFAGSLGGSGTNENNLSLTKAGVGSLTLSGATLSFNGSLAVNAGTLSITGGATGAPAPSAVTVGGGATLNLANSVGQAFDLGSGLLSLGGAAGATTLQLELGSTSAYDRILTSVAATSSNGVILNLVGLAGFSAGNYDLITAASGLNNANYSIGSISGGTIVGHTYAFSANDTTVRLAVEASTGSFYWSGSLSSSWAGLRVLDSNWSTDLAGTTNVKGTPGAGSSVIFSSDDNTATALATTLDGAFTIKDLTFNNELGTGPLASINIAAGTSGTLTLTPAASTAGIDIQTGAPATITISAPVTLGASQTWTVADAATILAVSGGIGGTANLTKAGDGILTLTGTNNYVGTTTVSDGVLRAGATNGFNQTSAHVVEAGGILRLNNFDATIGSLAGAGTVENGGAANARTLTVGGDNSSTTFSGILQNGGSFGLAFAKTGTGVLTLSGSSSTNTGTMNVNGGRLLITGTFDQGVNLGATGVGNGANTTGALYVPAGGSYASATLGIGGNASGVGSLVVTGGGSVTATTTNPATGITHGNGGYGGVFLSGAGSSISMPRYDTGTTVTSTAIGITQITGGTFTTTEYILLRNGRFDFTLTGGQVSRVSPTQIIAIGSEGAAAYGGALTVAGGTLDNSGQSIQFKRTGTMSGRASLNLNGGTVTTRAITLGTGTATALADVNFNGGTLKASAAGVFIPTGIDNLRVYSGGATIDSNGNDISIAEPILAPTGSGVSGVSSLVSGSGYIGAPFVEFSGGGGTGATGYAVVDLDPTSADFGKVTSVVISNPGVDYTSAPTVTLVGGLGVGGVAATVTADAPVANVSGGLTKVGGGTLTLSGANTFTGGTTVNVGTLALGANNTLADAGNVTIAGGTFDVFTFSDTVATVSLRGGAITGTTGVLTSTAAYDLRNGTVGAILGGGVGLTKSTADTVTLSRANTYSGVTTVTAGTLAFSAATHLGDASATNTITLDGGVLSFTAASAVSLSANQVMTIGANGGTLNASDAAGTLNLQGGIASSAAANLTKTGLGTVAVTGSTNLNGGDVTVSAGVLNAGFTANGVGDIVVAADATLNLYDGAATTMAITGLTLAGGSSLGFDLGATGVSDVLSLTGAATISPSVSLNFNALSGVAVGSYDLLSVSAGTLSAADYVLGLAPSGLNYNFTTVNDGQTLRLTTTLLNLVYWKGDVGGSWNSNNATDTNWASDLAGTTDLGVLPVATDTLVFSSSGATGPTFATTLDGDFAADSLKFTANPEGVTAVTVSQGTAGTLTLSPASSNNGITVATNAGAITISAPVATGATQTWEVVGGGTNGSSLVVSGAVAIGHLINKTGAGVLTLSGSNTGTGGINLAAGTLVIGNNNALGTGTFSIGVGTTLDTGAGAIVNAGGNVQNWNGNFTFTGTNTLNLGAGAVTLGDNVTLTAGNALTVGGAIGDGAASFGLTKAGAGALTLNGNNTFEGGVTLTAGSLNIGHANALGAGTLTLNGGTLDNTSGSALTLGGNIAQVWNGGFTFTGTNNLVMGAGAVTLAATTPITVTAGSLTVNGVIDDGAGTFNLNKAGAGTLTLGGLNTYGGATTLSRGALVYTADQNLTSSTNALNLGASAGSTESFSLELNGASARFGGAMLVQTSNTVANTITIGAGESLRVDGTVTIGFNSAANTTTRLTISGATGAFKIGDVGAPTNLGFQLGNSSTTNVNNAATLDMSGLGVFYANLGTGTFRVGDPTNAGGTGVAANGSTLILAADSTIIATTITSDSPAGLAIQRIKLGSGTNILNANTINIGGGAERATGTLDFNTSTGTVIIRALNGSARAAMNVQNGSAGTGTNVVGTVDFTGHEADLLLSTLAVGGRSAAVSAAGTGTFSFDTGTLDVTTINMAARTGTTSTSGMVTGTVNLGGGTVTIGTVTMSTNNVALPSGSSIGDAVSTLSISGGTHTITTLTMGVNTVSGATGNGSNTDATINITGGATTVSTAFTMGAQNSGLNAATNVNSALSTLNISAGSLTLAGSTNLVMGATTLDVNNAATATISITGTGSLTVGGNIQYTNGLGTETNTVTLNGGTLDLTGGNIGASGALITFNARAGTLRNLAELNGGGTLTKSTSGTLVLEGSNTFTGATLITGGTLSAAAGALAGTSGITVNGAVLSAINYNLAATLTLDATATAVIEGEGLAITGAIVNEGTTADALDFSAETGIISVGSLTGAGKTRFGASATITNGVTAGNVTVVGTLTAGVSAGTVTAGALTGNVSGGNVTVTNLLSGNVTNGTVAAGALTGNVGGGSVTVTNLLTGNVTAGTASAGSLASVAVTGGTTSVSGVASIGTLSSGAVTLSGATASIGILNGGTVNLGSTVLTVNSGSYAGGISGANGSLFKTTSGTLILSGANTFGGGTTVDAGILSITDAGALGGGAVTVRSGATLNLNSRPVSNAITILSGGTILGGQSAATTDTAGSTSVSSVLSGAGGLSKADPGTLTLTTPNFYEGATTASGANSVIRAAFLSDTSSSLGASALNNPANLKLTSGATLEFNGGTNATTSRSFTVEDRAGISATGTGALVFTSLSKIATTGTAPELTLTAGNSGDNVFGATMVEGGTAFAKLTVDGAGTWVIGSGANRFKNDVRIEVNGGTLGLQSGALPGDAMVALGDGSTVRWENGNSSAVKLTLEGGSDATLALGTNAVTLTTAPVVTGVGEVSLTKTGTGTLTIGSGFSGASVNVAVTTGTLAVNGTLGNVSLASGTTLGGSGFLGAVTTVSGSTVAPGSSPGIMNAESMALAGGTTFIWEVQDAQAGPGGTGYDKVVLSGQLDLSTATLLAPITLKIRSLQSDGLTVGAATNFGPPDGVSSVRSFEFATVQTGNQGVLLGSGLNISDVFVFDLSDFSYTGGDPSNASLWSIDWNQTSGAITLTAVPEPSTYGFGLGALALAAAAIRRRRKVKAEAQAK